MVMVVVAGGGGLGLDSLSLNEIAFNWTFINNQTMKQQAS